eukprot:gene17117-20388_t
MLLIGIVLYLFKKLYNYWFSKPIAQYAGKVVIVTGASSGIGSEIATQYAAMKCKVAIVARRVEQLEAVKSEIITKCAEQGVTADDILVVKADLTVETDCKDMVSTVIDKWGVLDICVWNAGAGSLIEFEKINGNFGVFRDNMNINFFSNVYCTSFALPYLKQQRGSIVVVSSLAGKFGTALRTSYSASKHALQGFLNSLRGEVPEVQITIVCPGFVQTEFHAKAATTTGKPIERKSGHFMTAKECAEHIILAERTRSREVLLGLKAKVGNYLLPFLPGLIESISNKTSNASIKKEQ